jgi:hypothetical protein
MTGGGSGASQFMFDSKDPLSWGGGMGIGKVDDEDVDCCWCCGAVGGSRVGAEGCTCTSIPSTCGMEATDWGRCQCPGAVGGA